MSFVSRSRVLSTSFVQRSLRSKAVRRLQLPCVNNLPPLVIFDLKVPTRSFAGLSLDLLKELRTISGAPVVDCKKALQTTNNDLNAALDWLREHGAAKTSSKVQGRETTEGLVAIQIADNNTAASIVRVSSETDFAGRSSKFVSFVSDVAAAIASSETTGRVDSNDILNAKSNGKTVKDLLDEAIVAIRENISVSDAIKINASDSNSFLIGYVHNKIHNNIEAGTAAAILEISPMKEGISTETLQGVGKKLAMHIVAAKPQYLTPVDVPIDEVKKETEILRKQIVGDAANKTKAPEMIEKIVQGKLRKYYQAVCLLEQDHMLEDKNPKVGSVLKEAGIEVKMFTSLSIA